MEVSVIILTKDEEGKLERCLKSVRWAGEIILIDDYSTDKTFKISEKFRVRIYKRHLNNDFSAQRNFALTKARNDWVFFVDADEVVSFKLAKAIQKLKNPKENGFLVKRQDCFFGKKIMGGESGGDWLLRLGRKNKGKWRRAVHEVWEIDGVTKKLKPNNSKIILLHSPHLSIESFLRKVNFYSALHAKENLKEGKKSSIVRIIIQPFMKFIYGFVFKSGFRDGTHGFVIAVMMSFHSFLSWSSMYLDDQKKGA